MSATNVAFFSGLEWLTDGTAAGTHEVIGSPNASFGYAVLNGALLFSGGTADGTPGVGLWRSDGTSAGTTEIASFVEPAYLTIYNGKALFNGYNSLTGHADLWVTDGTTNGTTELDVAGADTSLFGSGLNPDFFTPYNGKALFNCTNASGDAGLWVTDGSVNGTHELTGIAGADSSGLEPADLTVYNGKVYFYGLETDQTAGLWVTDGTAVGTHELAGVSPSDLTVLNGKLLFDGLDGGLWVTDGTAAGTHELTGIAGADSSGLEPSGFTPVTLAALTSNSILFQGTSGQAAIWNMTGANVSGGGPVSPNPGPAWQAIGTGDFTGDGFSDDILWQNTSSGQVSIWEMNGNSLAGGGPVSPNPGPSWKAIGTGDFNKDGSSDILFQNTTSGQVSIWEMDGTKLIGGGPVSPNPGPSWHAIGTGDFNHDGFSDILFQNTTSGQLSIWEMKGNTLVGGGPVSPNPGPSWHAIGTDGGSDILFQNTSGQASIWDMSGKHAGRRRACQPQSWAELARGRADLIQDPSY